MKRLLSKTLMVAVLSSFIAGCYGKFALTRKIYQVNGQVSDKFLRSAVTWAFVIVPVYGLAAFVDFVLFNTIEFWSGHNPVASADKDFQYAEGDERFDVHAVKKGEMLTYTINRYNNGRYVDQVFIDWDLKTKNSTVKHIEFEKTTVYAAAVNAESVTVASTLDSLSTVKTVHQAFNH